MVKCSECGFLAIRRQEDGRIIDADATYRTEGFQAYQRDTTFPTPNCYIREQPIHLEPFEGAGTAVKLAGEAPGLIYLGNKEGVDVTDQFVLSIIHKERICSGFTRWRGEGITPKEHREMQDRDNVLRWQREREESDKAFQAREASENRKWRFREFLVAVIGVAVLITVSLVAAFIERGGQPTINIVVSDKSGVTQSIQPGEQLGQSNNAP